MSMQDSLADMLARIRNAQLAKKAAVTLPSSTLKVAVAHVLKDEGYIQDYRVEEKAAGHRDLHIDLKYFQGEPVIAELVRISKSSRRQYAASDALPKVKDGLGVAIVSTSQGVMADHAARKAGIGGEILCTVY